MPQPPRSRVNTAREHFRRTLEETRQQLLAELAEVEEALREFEPRAASAVVSKPVGRPMDGAEKLLRERGDWMPEGELLACLERDGYFAGLRDVSPRRAFRQALAIATKQHNGKRARFVRDQEGRIGLGEWQLAEKAGV